MEKPAFLIPLVAIDESDSYPSIAFIDYYEIPLVAIDESDSYPSIAFIDYYEWGDRQRDS